MEQKKKKKSLLVKVVIALVVVILIISLAIKMFGGRAVKAGIQTAGSKVLGVGVRVDHVGLWTLLGKVEMKKLEVDNPEGYKHEQLLKMELAHVDLNVPSLLSDTVEIDKMQFDKIELVIEQKGLTSNLNEILKNIPKSEEKPTEDTPTKEKGEGKNLVIKELIINEVTVKADLPVPGKMDTVTLKIDPITMTDVGKKNKVNTAALMSIILKAITKSIAQQGKDILPAEMIGPLGDTLKEAGQQLLESGKDVLKEGTDLGKGVGEAIEGLFKKKEEEEK